MAIDDIQGEPDWTPDPLIAELEDALGGQESRALHGFFAGSTEGTWRLYQSLDLGDFVEGRDEDLLHRERVSTTNPLAGSVIWVRAHALVTMSSRIEALKVPPLPRTPRCLALRYDRTPRC